MHFLRLIRFPNLLIVALTQYLLQYLIIIPTFRSEGLMPLLDGIHFFLLVVSTMLIAASGYVINDLEDYQIDLLNKPEKIILNQHISFATAWKFYWAIVGSGFFISLYLAFYVHNIPLVLIYPLAILLLFIYSKSLKKSVLWGNIIVSIFCAFVAGIILFAEREDFWKLMEKKSTVGNTLLEVFVAYLLFAFFSTMFREIIKDIEDIDGDLKNNCKTLPIVFGKKTAKAVAAFFGMTLLGLLIFWFQKQKNTSHFFGQIYLVVGIMLPLIVALFQLKNAQTKSQFHQLSQWAKYIMLSGILYLVVWYFGRNL